MKRKIVLKAPIDQLFTALVSPTIEGYQSIKNRKPTEEELKHGLTYQTVVQGSNPKRYATIKVLKYEKPFVFSMEYTSSTFHKIDTISLQEKSNGKTELITERIEERIKNGKIISSKGKDDSNIIKHVSFWEAQKYRRLANALNKGAI